MNIPHLCLTARILLPLASLISFIPAGHGQVQTFLETGFESGIPAGWTQEQVLGSASWNTQTGGTANGGAGNNPSSAYAGDSNATLFFPSNSSDNVTRLITPALDTTDYTNLTLTF